METEGGGWTLFATRVVRPLFLLAGALWLTTLPLTC